MVLQECEWSANGPPSNRSRRRRAVLLEAHRQGPRRFPAGRTRRRQAGNVDPQFQPGIEQSRREDDGRVAVSPGSSVDLSFLAAIGAIYGWLRGTADQR